MSSEYVRFSGQEAIMIQKALLNSELNILKSSKNLNQYKLLRHKEQTIKINIKSILDQLKNDLNLLDKSLPKSQVKEEKIERSQSSKTGIMESGQIQEYEETDNSIESQLREIQEKLARLQ